ncbi:MAG: SIR2 family protein, partial [Candidatus Odinarchaeota archaeon]
MGEPRHIKGYDLLKGEEGNWKRFFFDKSDLTFLVGAGISINPPSNLMPARGMMEAVLKFGADPAIVGKLLTIPELRYEYLIQEFRDKYDPDLVILDYFEECTQPNVIHTFLARMINLGHFVMTTNFDTLIERAVGLDNPSLQIVITRKDFEKYGDPQANWKKGLRIVYKLHGSKINAKTGEDTRESVIITLDGLGKRKDGDFSVEMFKKPLFLRIVVGRTLIIMGYSGGDDFDIVPTMTQLSGLKRVIWISHDEVVKDPVIYRLNHASVSSAEEKIGWCNEDNLLYTIYRTTGAEVIKIVGNTSSLVAELNDTPHLISQTSVKRDFFNWLLDNFPPPSAEHRTFFTARIFHNYQFSQEALLYYQKTLEISQKSNNFSLLASALNNMGLVYSDIGEPQKAVEHFQKSQESY